MIWWAMLVPALTSPLPAGAPWYSWYPDNDEGGAFLDTTYKPYVSYNKEQDDNEQPQYYQPTDGQQVLKKVVAFNNKVLMPCFVAEPVKLLPNTKKPKYHILPNATCKTFIGLAKGMQYYKMSSALVSISAKSTYMLYSKYLKTGTFLLSENSQCKPILLIREHSWAIKQ
ncbi:hypothetical protein DSO57_1007241 [Entomophthora muscae]|uniref:Uncharacterized protein n=1 Tax=Entomophthora muscae TaxID=34485 RepID=A0ACC2UH86_9FUNG|nr:hypothetical protein DSO57_1007241 [Entomophthora muscae]